jgi:hypothetical protein
VKSRNHIGQENGDPQAMDLLSGFCDQDLVVGAE